MINIMNSCQCRGKKNSIPCCTIQTSLLTRVGAQLFIPSDLIKATGTARTNGTTREEGSKVTLPKTAAMPFSRAEDEKLNYLSGDILLQLIPSLKMEEHKNICCRWRDKAEASRVNASVADPR